jgi:hypothetical protein
MRDPANAPKRTGGNGIPTTVGYLGLAFPLSGCGAWI